MTLDVSNDYKVKLVDEMYANDEEWFTFIGGDVVKAYYFGISVSTI